MIMIRVDYETEGVYDILNRYFPLKNNVKKLNGENNSKKACNRVKLCSYKLQRRQWKHVETYENNRN